MHLSASAIAALLVAAGVGTLTEAAPAASRTAASVTPMPTQQSPQGKAGDGNARQAMAA